MTKHNTGPWVLVITVLSALGCGREEPIRSYRVAKETTGPGGAEGSAAVARPVGTSADTAVPPGGEANRMLAAIVTHGDRVWTLKFTGPTAVISQFADAFEGIVASLAFDEAGEATWTTPSTWQKLPPSGMRAATLVPDGAEKGVDFSIIALAAPQDVLANVNRWRSQMQLPLLTGGDLAGATRRVTTASGDEATVVDLQGRLQAGMMAPFASGTAGPTSPPGPAADPETEKSPVQFTAPPEWSPRPTRMSQVHLFELSDGDRKAEVSISVLSRAGGELLPNINRWRAQLQLPPWSPEELESALTERRVGDLDAKMVELLDADGPTATIGVVAYRGDAAWFFKISGDKDLVRAERERFAAFLHSIQFVSD